MQIMKSLFLFSIDYEIASLACHHEAIKTMKNKKTTRFKLRKTRIHILKEKFASYLQLYYDISTASFFHNFTNKSVSSPPQARVLRGLGSLPLVERNLLSISFWSLPLETPTYLGLGSLPMVKLWENEASH